MEAVPGLISAEGINGHITALGHEPHNYVFLLLTFHSELPKLDLFLDHEPEHDYSGD